MDEQGLGNPADVLALSVVYNMKGIIVIISILLIGCSENQTGSNGKFGLVFSSDSKSEYHYTQSLLNSMSMDCNEFSDTITISGSGTITILGTSSDLANFIMTSDEMLKDGVPTNSANNKIEIQDLQPNGKFKEAEAGVDMMFQSLFACPTEDIELGEASVDIVTFPLNLQGSRLKLQARYIVTYEKDTIISEKKCAVLRAEFSNMGIKQNSILTKESNGNFEGYCLSIFDLDNHSFVYSESTTTIHFNIQNKNDSELCLKGFMKSDCTLSKK